MGATFHLSTSRLMIYRSSVGREAGKYPEIRKEIFAFLIKKNGMRVNS